MSGGRKLFSPGGKKAGPGEKQTIRPTSDRAREAIFNIIGSGIKGAHVLDLFAGSGALGLEALSRGAKDAVFVDCQRSAVNLVRKNIALCGFTDISQVVKYDLGRDLPRGGLLPARQFDLVFVDPPYGKQLSGSTLERLAASEEFLAATCLVVVEVAHNEDLPAEVGSLFLSDRRRYGEAAFWLYRKNKEQRHDLL